MYRGQKLLCRACLITAASFLMIQTPAYAGTWISEEHGEWAYLSQEGTRVNGWVFDETDKEWYFLNDSGIMLASTWIYHTDGHWYYLEASGAMRTNAWIAGQDGKWYYVGSDGAMLTSTVTPDGYTVDSTGGWDDQIPKKTVSAARKKGGGSGGGRSSHSKGNSHSSGNADSEEKKDNANDGSLNQVPEKSMPQELPVATPSEAEMATPSEAGRDDSSGDALAEYQKFGLFLTENDQNLVNDYVDSLVAARKEQAVLIGQAFYPYSYKLADNLYPELENVTLRRTEISDQGITYHVAVYSFTYRHEHSLQETAVPASCTMDGLRQLICSCGYSKDMVLPKLGHVDLDGDSICDRCGRALEGIGTGTVLSVSTGLSAPYDTMDFVCVDDEYGGGFLFLAREVIPYGMAPGYSRDSGSYRESKVREWLNTAYFDGLGVSSRIQKVVLPESEDGYGDYVFCLSKEEVRIYEEEALAPWEPQRGAAAYWTRSEDQNVGGYAYCVSEGGHVASGPVTDRNTGVRPAFVLGGADEGEPGGRMYMVGDTQMRELNGQSYQFRCIDADYIDSAGNPLGALFLCDTIIGGNEALFDEGGSNSWETSGLRSWLDEHIDNRSDLADTDTTVSMAYTGSTSYYDNYFTLGAFTKSPLGEGDILPSKDLMFCLSLEEAARYKEYLWRLDGADENNYIAAGTYNAGYWLRTPYQYDGSKAYMVTYEGRVTAGVTNNESVGFRPAYVIKQK